MTFLSRGFLGPLWIGVTALALRDVSFDVSHGTVIGIMRAFHSMAIAGTGGFGVVAGGISEALIATALGLAIGIISLVFYNYLQNRVERIDGALRIGSARLLEAVALSRGPNGVR